MRKQILLLLAVGGVVGLIWLGIFAYRNLRWIGPAFGHAPVDIAKLAAENKTGLPLKIPDGFSIEIFAKDLSGARVMAFDIDDMLWVSRTSEGILTRLDVRPRKVIGQKDILTGLRKPHGLAFDPENPRFLYYAEENKISRFDSPPLGSDTLAFRRLFSRSTQDDMLRICRINDTARHPTSSITSAV